VEIRENNNGRMRFALIRLGIVSLLAAGIFLLLQLSPLSEWDDPASLDEWLTGLSQSPWAGLIVILGFMAGSLIVFPVTAMIAATGIALGPAYGLLWASAGALLGASFNYALARMLPDHLIARWVGSWVGNLGTRFKGGGIVPVMVMRTLPVAPFTLINFIAGSARIPYRDFMIGTVLGMGPIIAALTILGDRLRDAWRSPTALNFALLIVALMSWFLLAMALQALSNRWAAARRRQS